MPIYTQKVKVSLGATLKIDPTDPKCYEFLRLDVGYERDLPFQSDTKKAYEEAWNIVETELTESFNELRNNIKKLNEG